MSGPRGGGMGNSGPRGIAASNSGPGRAVYDVPSPTRPYGPAGGTLPRTGRITGPNGLPDRPDDEEGGRRNGPIVGMVVAGVVVLLALSCFVVLSATGAFKLLALGGGATPTATTAFVTVPSFKGLTVAQAQQKAQQYGLTVAVTASTQTTTTPQGQVVDQSPEPGSYQGITSVGLIISGGPGQIALPNLKGKDEVSACDILTKAPYFLVCADQGPEQNDQVPAGLVTRTDPPAGTLVTAGTANNPGQAIKIWTSIGPPTPTPTLTPIPDPTATCVPSTATVTSSPTPCP